MAAIQGSRASSQISTKGLDRHEAAQALSADAIQASSNAKFAITRPPTTTPTVSGWTASSDFSYWKDPTKEVHVQGSLTVSGTPNTLAFVFPAGFLPGPVGGTGARAYIILGTTNGTPAPTSGFSAIATVASSGALTITKLDGTALVVGEHYFLDPVSFLAEQ